MGHQVKIINYLNQMLPVIITDKDTGKLIQVHIPALGSKIIDGSQVTKQVLGLKRNNMIEIVEL